MSQDRSNTGASKSRTYARLLAGAALLVPGVAHAQAAPPPQPSVTDSQNADTPQTTKTSSGDIIVVAKHYVPQGAETATKSDIPLIQTPQSVSVITRDQMDQHEGDEADEQHNGHEEQQTPDNVRRHRTLLSTVSPRFAPVRIPACRARRNPARSFIPLTPTLESPPRGHAATG